MIQVKLPDGSVHEYPEGTRPSDVAEKIGPRLAKAVIAAEVNGQVVDLHRPLEANGTLDLKLLTSKDPEALGVLRHSTAHVMARAVMRLYEGVQLAFGPTVENGFYYDFELPDPIREEDFPRIEKEIRKIISEAEPFERFELSVDEAREFCRDLDQRFKVEHIDDTLKQSPSLSSRLHTDCSSP